MNLIGHIEVGNMIEVALDSATGLTKVRYKSEVVKIIDDNKIIIKKVKSGNSFFELPYLIDYKFNIYTKDGVYEYIAKVLSNYNDVEQRKRSTMEIELIKAGEKIQRREAFRFYCELPVTYDKFGKISFDEKQRGIVVDLSAGGVKFLGNREFEKNDRVDLELNLHGELLFLEAEILYIDEIKSDIYKYQYRCKFNNLLVSDKDIIIQYVLDVQRSALKKRKFTNEEA